MPTAKLALSFRLFQDGQLIREDTLTQSVIKIGKVPSAHLQIADEAVSRMHAIVEITGREVNLIDLGSTRGTFVNGKKINKARLETGDVIMLGDTRIELAIRDAEAPAPAPADQALEIAIDHAGDAPARPPAIPQAVRRAAATGAVTISGTIETRSAAAPPPVPAAAAPAIPQAVRRAAATGAVTISGTIETPRSPTAPPPVPAASAPAATAPEPAPTAPPALALAAARPAVFAHAVESAGELGAARAVEIAAMLGDSVVGVKHCIDPRSGRVTLATWGLVAGGAACLIASAIAFAASVQTAAENRARFETWTRIEHKPAYAFRPRVLGPSCDWVAFGGAGLALVGLGLGVARMRRERISPYYRIGTAPGVELAVDGAPAPAFPLIAPSGDDFVFNYGAGIDGELVQDGKSTPLAELAAAGRARPSTLTAGATEVPIPSRARIRARAGKTTFLISAVARPRRHAVPVLAGLQSRALAYFAGSLAVHLGVWAILQLLPPEATTVSVIVPTSEPPYIPVRIPGTEAPVPPPSRDPGSDSGSSGSAPMPLPSGASGDPASLERGRLMVKRADIPPQRSRDQEIERARDAGFLGVLGTSSAVRTLSGLPGPDSGYDDASFNGPIYGGYGEGAGSFGGGISGLFGGGGCTEEPCGTIGTQPGYGTIGSGRHAGSQYGFPGHGVGLPAFHPTGPEVGKPTITRAGYDKSIVRRYIRQNIDKIGYCYDKQLLAHPGIAGELTVTFLIAPTGGVQGASGTGFDREVASCVAQVIQTIAFPRPGDGIGVQVTYPFHFHPTGK